MEKSRIFPPFRVRYGEPEGIEGMQKMREDHAQAERLSTGEVATSVGLLTFARPRNAGSSG
jgi:hypothetical protein